MQVDKPVEVITDLILLNDLLFVSDSRSSFASLEETDEESNIDELFIYPLEDDLLIDSHDFSEASFLEDDNDRYDVDEESLYNNASFSACHDLTEDSLLKSLNLAFASWS